jgi:hypothetical protein
MVSVRLFLICFAQADQSHFWSAHGVNQSVQVFADESIRHGPFLAIVATSVARHLRGTEIEIDRSSQIDTVLHDIGLILGAIEFKLHDLIVYTKRSLVQ